MFYQNAEGNINMGVLFNDPDAELDDIHWYNVMAIEIDESVRKHEGLISIETIKLHNTDEELKTYSCYVELHRTGLNEAKYNPRKKSSEL